MTRRTLFITIVQTCMLLILTRINVVFLKGIGPAAGSPTATLLRLHSSRRLHFCRKEIKSWVVSRCDFLNPLSLPYFSISRKIISQSVTGDVYKAQVQIHRAMLIHDYWQFHLHEVELQTSIRTVIIFHVLLRLASLHQIVIIIVARL